MLLKKLTLDNFRQFMGTHEIEFSTDDNKNVTIIMGDNAVGKTTLAQAFKWVLYGSVDFDDKIVLNGKMRNELNVNEEAQTKVMLILVHNDIEYRIIRIQKFRKEPPNEFKIAKPEVAISFITKDGQTDFIRQEKVLSTINSIMPEALSRYFFFDGERINNMNHEVKSGRSKEFSEAVKNLLGLTALKNAIDHFNPNSKDSVIGRYNKEIDQVGGQKSQELREIIYSSNELLEKNQNRIDEINKDIAAYAERTDNVKQKLLEMADAEKSQQRLNELNENVVLESKRKDETTKSFFKYFSKNSKDYFANVMIKDSLDELDETDNIDKGIPDVTKDTIEFLLRRGKCICGEDLSNQTGQACRTLMEQLKNVPPEYVGTSIRTFVNEAQMRSKNSSDFFTTCKDYIHNIRSIADIIEETKRGIGEIDKSFLMNSNKKITDLKNNQMNWEREGQRLSAEKDSLNRDIGKLESQMINAENEINKLEKINNKNEKVEEFKKYAEAVYEKLKRAYDFKEQEVRKTLEQEMNTLFSQIYAGAMNIRIDDKYNIATYVSELQDNSLNLDRSTSQGYSVIFAFIVAIINMAKKVTNGDSELVASEVYPLVMDAPLSAFDKRRIKNICNVIPGIARQVIIFIKDTDGDSAKENMMNRIGAEYEMKKMNGSELSTYIEKRSDDNV